MSKFKIENSNGQNFLVIQGQKGQQISEREYYAISTCQIPGLLRAELTRKGNSFKLSYNISGYISLKEFLVNPLNKQSFAALLNNILNNLKALQKAYYNYQFILMDINAAMVNPTTHQVSFVYVPITFYESGTDLKAFLLNIIQCCSFAPGENTDYVRDYIRILNHGINFSVFDLEEYIKKLRNEGQNCDQAKKCTRCGAPIQLNVNFCPSCGMKILGFDMENYQGIYDPAKVVARPQARETVANGEANGSQAQYYNMGLRNFYAGGGQIPNVSVLHQRCAYITRCKTGEQMQIAADVFRIGKDPNNCEYCIRDNSAISRCHAVIKSENNKWFISDLNSTNKTYIYDRLIYPYVDVELLDGMSIKLANENFVFNLY